MRRSSPILSLPGLMLFVVLLGGLGFTIWHKGGLAFSPGALSAKSDPEVRSGEYESHAEFESQCAFCHQPLTSTQGELCIDCHNETDDQVMTGRGLHARIEEVMRCAECHPDHRGRGFDTRMGSLEYFDHSILDFSLIWHQVDYSLTPIDCMACHVDGNDFSIAIQECVDCHADHDPDFMDTHSLDFQEGCLNCHDGMDSMVRFDHSSSDFPLVGSHLEVRCAECHKNGQFEDVARSCVHCHAEPAVHEGIFSLDCTGCHDADAWKPVLLGGRFFDHSVQPSFSIDRHKQDYTGSAITCAGCHVNSVQGLDLVRCIECHAENDQVFINEHLAQFGEFCLECHDGIDRMNAFDHADFFPLDGCHIELDCQDCHDGYIYKETSNECSACHVEPEIHVGFFGLKCEYCHVTSSWYPAQLNRHPFPINHGDQGEQECQVCHIDTYSEYTCFGCHEHQLSETTDSHQREGISSQELSMCIHCHAEGHVDQSVEK
jgi:hypothetical protein